MAHNGPWVVGVRCSVGGGDIIYHLSVTIFIFQIGCQRAGWLCAGRTWPRNWPGDGGKFLFKDTLAKPDIILKIMFLIMDISS